VQFLNGSGVVTEIFLAANEDNGMTCAEVKNLRDPLNDGKFSQPLNIKNDTRDISPFPGRYPGNPANR